MSSIYDEAVRNLDGIAHEYGEILGDIATVAQQLRKKFLADGTIVAAPVFSSEETGAVSLCAIDGASASEKMQSADLLVAGATLHDGAVSKKLFQDKDSAKPFMSYSDIRIHSSKNEEILSAMRAFTEISVLGAAPHDISIIDGAYLGNFLTVLYKLQESPNTAERIIEYMKKDTEGNFIAGLNKILNVKERILRGKEVIALAKSDSSRDMVKEYTGGADFFVTDKILAEYLLEPGEMLLPLSVNANRGRVGLLEYSKEDVNWAGFQWNPRKVLSKEDFDVVQSFFKLGRKDNDQDAFSQYSYLYSSSLYHYTYFKPSKFTKSSNAIRVEFTTDGLTLSNPEGRQKRLEKAKEMVGHVNSDIISPMFKEPYSQYMVDQDVKKPVSSSLRYIRASLPGKIRSDLNVGGLVSGYRT